MREFDGAAADAIDRYDAEIKQWHVRPMSPGRVLVERWPALPPITDKPAAINCDKVTIERDEMSESMAKDYIRQAAMAAALGK